MERLVAFCILLPILAGCATTDAGAVVPIKDLGVIPQAASDSQLARELHSLLLQSPAAPLAAVKATADLSDSGAVAYYKLIYDKGNSTLVLMMRTVRPGRDDFYHLSVYDETAMDEFQDRLPMRGYKGYPRTSQSFNKHEHRVPISYRRDPELVSWP